jgi:hypothetical protein
MMPQRNMILQRKRMERDRTPRIRILHQKKRIGDKKRQRPLTTLMKEYILG